MNSIFNKYPMRCFLISMLFMVTVAPSQAQSNRKQRMYNAFINGNLNQWVQIVDEMEHSSEPKTLAWKMELAEYYYGLSGYYLGQKKNDLAAPIISKGNALLDGILREHPENATAMSLKGSMTAFKINLNRYKAMTLGRESLSWMEKALNTEPDNVQALSDRGSAYMHAPAIFGGDPEAGIQMFRKGLSLLEKRNLASGNWFYLNLLVTTGKAYEKTGHLDKAKQYYQRALAIEPRFRLVKEVLLPTLKNKS